MTTGSENSAYPIVGADGVVYLGLNMSVYALSPAGNVLWTYPTTNFIMSFPLIGGTADPATGGSAVLYLPSRDHNIYKISGTRTGLGANNPPVADAGGPYGPALVGQAVIFDGSGSSDPDPGDAITWSWDFGDGGLGSGANPSHVYLSPSPPGGYPVTLTVSDGLATANATVHVVVTGNPIGNFVDDFNRDASDQLGGPDPGGPEWAEVAGNLAISGGRVVNTLVGYNMAILPALPGADQSAEADFTSGSNNTAPKLGVVLRALDAVNHYRLYRSAGGSSQVRIAKVVGGVETILKFATLPQAIVNTPFHLKGTIAGSTLTLWLDGVQMLDGHRLDVRERHSRLLPLHGPAGHPLGGQLLRPRRRRALLRVGWLQSAARGRCRCGSKRRCRRCGHLRRLRKLGYPTTIPSPIPGTSATAAPAPA